MMRVVFLIFLLAGAGIAFGYPMLLRNAGAHEVGSWEINAGAETFTPVETALVAGDAPVRAIVDMTAVVPAAFDKSQTVLTITAATSGRTVLAEALNLEGAKVRDDSPQTPQQIYRVDAGTLSTVEKGTYVFTVGPGDAEGVAISAVELILQGGGGAPDPRAQPLGFSLMAIGFIGFILSFRRRSNDISGAAPAPPVVKPRWGRDAGER
jgi:hypothetical protein